jgi:acyl carrier protein
MFLSGSLETLRTDILEVHDLASKKDGLYTRIPTEVAVAGIWEEVLGFERVEIHDDFFELGGHSMLAMQVMTRLNQHFGVELLPRALFDAPTVAGLALAITQAKAEAETDIDQILAIVEQMQGGSVSQEESSEVQ